jgi:adenylyl- and sulfurtransferase ThiI
VTEEDLAALKREVEQRKDAAASARARLDRATEETRTAAETLRDEFGVNSVAAARALEEQLAEELRGHIADARAKLQEAQQ